MSKITVIIYRIGNWFHRNRMGFIGKLFTYINRLIFATWIPSSVKIGKNFIPGYGGLGIVIHSVCEIGDNCKISQNVTIGKNFKDSRVPQIGNDVYIGTGSVIFGDITIGNNVIIGSNTLVNKSIPDNSTVIGNPMVIIERDRSLKYYEIEVSLEKK